MGNKNTKSTEAVKAFEQWRREQTEIPSVDSTTSPKEAPTESEAKGNAVDKTFEVLKKFFTTIGIAIVTFGKASFEWLKQRFARSDDGAKTQGVSEAKPHPAQTETTGEKTSILDRIKSLPAAIKEKYSAFSARSKKVALISVITGVAFILLLVSVIKFEFVTPDAGIKTNLGSGAGHVVFIEKNATIAPNDLIVAVQPGSSEDSPELIIGTVFSFNEETYALYDGEVIWQIPVADLKGKVLFAEATQKLP